MQKFYVVVHLVRKIAVDYLVEKLKAGKVITKDQVLRDSKYILCAVNKLM